MGDSDDEYDRRRARDKFRRERSDYQEHGGSGRGVGGGGGGGGSGGGGGTGGNADESSRPRGRDDYAERRELWTRDRGRRDYREQVPDPRGRRERPYSPGPRHDISPPMKKMRRDWEDRSYGYDSGFGTGSSGASHQNWGSSSMDMGPGSLPAHLGYVSNDGRGGPRYDLRRDGVDGLPTQPPVMTFKQFLTSQDDGIGDEEAVRKYNEYKLEFRRLQLNKFFLAHKEEEWFRLKYQPEESTKKRQEHLASLKRRVDVFLEMMNAGRIESLSVDAERADDVVKLLDAVVIRLEGGSDFDLKILDETEEERLERAIKPAIKPLMKEEIVRDKIKTELEKEDSDVTKKDAKVTPERTDDKGGESKDDVEMKREPASVASEIEEKKSPGKLIEGDKEEEKEEAGVVKEKAIEKKEKQKKVKSEFSSEDEEGESGSDSDDGDGKNGMAVKDVKSSGAKSPASTHEERVNKEDGEVPPKKEPKESKKVEEESEPDPSAAAAVIKGVTEPVSDDGEATEGTTKNSNKSATTEVVKPVVAKVPLLPTPRALHRTCSIFLRNLAPTITKQEVETMCRRFPGFLRVAIADPQPERRFFRRGWVTFDRSVNIKEICWNLNNVRLRDCELGAIVNRDLTRRIRSCSGIAVHKQVVRADIKHAAKLVQSLDVRFELWSNENGEDDNQEENGQLSFGLVSRNPLLKNITDYLIEEASAEEEELLGLSSDSASANNVPGVGLSAVGDDGTGKKNEESCIERDDALTKVLDRLLLYLRIVHSVDYYNHSDYPNEDEMPNRCGIMHARGPPPLNRLTPHEISDYMAHFEAKLSNFQQPVPKMSNDEAIKLGRKDPTVEVEKFVTANTIELGKDKWLCPLSGKKFKGPEFVRKHIFNKHGEKVEEVKREVEYFNNYVTDPKRPQLPEHPGNRPPRLPDAGSREAYGQQSGYQGGHLGGSHSYPPYGGGGGGGYAGQNPRVHAGYGGRGRDAYGDNYRNFGNSGGGGAGYFNHKRGAGRNRGGEGRELIGYHDLDAPEDVDVF